MPKEEFPVVLRFANVSLRQLARIQMHGRRSGGPLDHVEPAFSSRNRVYVGENFAADMRAEIREIARANLDAELAALHARKRKKEAKARAAEGARDPWHANSDGPLREVILTAHTDYFRAPDKAPDRDVILTFGMNDDGSTRVNRLCRSKVATFEARGLAFFDEHFPGAVRHLRLDLDEEAPHFHAVLMQTEEKTTKSRGRQVVLRPAANALLKDYEHAQDVAGDFFARIGLVRGKRGKAARRDAREAGLPQPEAVRHTSPRAHREARLARVRAAEDAARRSQEAAQSALSDAEAARVAAMSDAAATRLAATRQAEEAAHRIEAQARAAAEKTTAEAEARAEALVAAVETGIDALLSGEIEYVPRTEEKRDTIRRGPTARGGSAFDALIARIKPAGRRIVRLARKVFELQQRGRALDARADAQTRDARVLDDTRRLLGAEPDRRLRTLAARPLAVGFRPEAIPGAWAVAADRHDSRTVQAALDQMSNVALRQTLLATRDAVRIFENEPVLRRDLGRAAKLLEFAAAQRGYDPEADTHDPRRAKDSSRARLHTDTESIRIHVTRRDTQRQRVRGD